MKRTDPVYFRYQPVGTAVTEKQGLYYRFQCCCRFPRPGMYSLKASCGENTEDLGICIPEGKDFVLTTRIPVKRFADDAITFTAVMKNEEERMPVCSEAPFPSVERLEHASFVAEDGDYWIILHQDNCCPAEKDSVHP